MTSTNPAGHVGGHRREVDFQKLGPALVIASTLVLAIRTARWPPTHSDGLANMEWEKEIEHSVPPTSISAQCAKRNFAARPTTQS